MPGAVEPDEQLEWEQRAGRPAGIAALLAGTLLLLGAILAARGRGDDAFDTYLNIHDDASLILAPNIVQAIGYLFTAYALWYLVGATTPRRPELAKPSKVMAILGPLANAVAVILTALAVIDIASAVADVVRPPRSEDARDDLLEDLQGDSGVVTAAAIASLVGRIALGFALLLASLNAMRAGLLSRFTGILGVISGILTVLFGGASFFLAFWLAAIGAIFLDRWPSGRGPAWDEVEAIPWPSAMDKQRAAMEAAGEDDEEYAEHEDDEEYAEEEEEEEPASEPHPSSNKRKKKRRR